MDSQIDLLGLMGKFVEAHPWSPAALAGTALLVVLIAGYGLLAERQRRVTIVAVFDHAPGGSVVTQKRGPGGPALTIWVGHGPRPPGAPPLLHIIVQKPVSLPLERVDGDDR